MRVGLLGSIASVICLAVSPATAQTYPTRQVTFIVPFAAGGPIDNNGRTFAEAMRRQLSSAVIVDNKPGAGGVVGTKAVASAKPDGYTLLVASPGPLIIAPAAGTSAVDPETQLTAVGLISDSPQIVVVTNSLPVTSLTELIAHIKANPGKLSYSSAGIGTTPHLAGELMRSLTGIDMLHVPYRGTGAALPDLLSGRNQLMIGDITSMLPMLEGGRLRALAITGAKRSDLVPNVPTVAEAGLAKLITRNWSALMGPKGLPEAVVSRLAEAMKAALKDQEYIAAMRKQGAEPAESSPEHLAKFIAEERDTLAPIVKAIGLKLE